MSVHVFKVLVIGPKKAGKSALSNFLADISDTPSSEYRPTQGVRILEFDKNVVDKDRRQHALSVRMWDCSGDRRYENTWPALIKDADCAIIVVDANDSNSPTESDFWFSRFVAGANMHAEKQCLVFAHKCNASKSKHNEIRLSDQMSSVYLAYTNLETEQDLIKESFNSLLSNSLSIWIAKREREEDGILNN